MNNNETDIFEATKKSLNPQSDNNFFLTDENMNMSDNKPVTETLRHINDYDFNIIKDGAYKDISNDSLKMEYKISETENEIKDILSQLNVAKEMNDTDNINLLQEELDSLNNYKQSLLAMYNDKTISAKISDFISGVFEKTVGITYNGIKQSFDNTYETILSKLPNKYSSLIQIKKSLSVLENINKSVDELMSMTIPHGENVDKYQQLSRYIIKAHSVQSEISNILKK